MPKNDQIIKTIIGFCNQHGGKLIIGVADDGTVTGLHENEIALAVESLGKTIHEASAPPIPPLVYSQIVADKSLLVIEVSAGTNKPYYRKSEGLDRGTYVRLGPLTMRANADLIEELKWQSRGRSYDTLPVYSAAADELDEKKVQQFIELRKERKQEQVTREMLFAYYLLVEEHSRTYATAAGILLFGKKPQHFLTESFIICSHFQGNEGREAIASIDCTGTLFEQFHTAFNFIVSRLSRSFTIQGPRRKETLEIPEVAIREALLNAIVHRNYHINGPIKIAIYENRVEIFSPGTLAGPLNVRNLKMGLSYIRNIAICKVFREAGYIEKLGSGFLIIFKSYADRKLKTPLVIDGENFVKCILPREAALPAEAEELEAILDLFHSATHLTISDVMLHLKWSRTTAGRRLERLVQLGKIRKVGKGRGTSYKLLSL